MLCSCCRSKPRPGFTRVSTSHFSKSEALVARQSLISRPATQWRLSQRSLPSYSTSCSYSSTASLRTSEIVPRVHYGTILARKPQDATVEEIVSRIRPIDVLPNSTSALYPLAVFILTPTLSRWLTDDATFLQKALQRVFANQLKDEGKRFEAQALVAVVNQLPSPSCDVQRKNDYVVADKTRSQPIPEKPFEGLAYAVASSTCLDLEAGAENETFRPDIAFKRVYTLGVTVRTVDSSAQSRPSSSRLYSVRIPLANTIFQTGRDCTLFISAWKKLSDRSELAIQDKKFYANISFEWPSDTLDAVITTLPLIPLTWPRKVHSGMGNIIKQTINADGDAMSASQELEKAVLDYFKALRIPQSSIPIWALILSQDSARLMELALEKSGARSSQGLASSSIWTSTEMDKTIVHLINQGGRLHRVQSGGGGWGKKAGLLALDPATYEKTEDLNDKSLSFPLVEDFATGLGAIANADDFIQFFTTHLDTENAEPEALRNNPRDIYHGSLDFGTSFHDMNATSHAVVESDSTAEDMITCESYFGALSESGISIRGLLNATSSTGTRDVSSREENEFMRTKVDVPGSKFSFHVHPLAQHVVSSQKRRALSLSSMEASSAAVVKAPHATKSAMNVNTAADSGAVKKNTFQVPSAPVPSREVNSKRKMKIRKVFSKNCNDKKDAVFIRRVYKVAQQNPDREDAEAAWDRMLAMRKLTGSSLSPSNLVNGSFGTSSKLSASDAVEALLKGF